MSHPEDTESRPLDFVRAVVEGDLAQGLAGVVTRFPPEPSGYLHIGHAKAICLNFGIAAQYGGRCHLRFDDTNPTREKDEYVEQIQRDIRWLGWDWKEHLYFASDYFDALFDYAAELVRRGQAFVCDLSADEIRATRGTLTEPGQPSPFRERSPQENLERFSRMRAGDFDSGACVLRAKIDMSSGNINMRDPVLYRIQRDVPHYRTGDRWCIYPTYDFAHCLSDAIEGVTHSLCSIEFEDHRPLYDWILEQADAPCRPKQIEFAKLEVSHTVPLGKRSLRRLIEDGHVRGWDDPRMPTLAGMRRRGYTPEAIRSFCDGIGVAKRAARIELARLEFSLRDDLNRRALRVMGVLRPLRVVIENYPEGESEEFEAINNPEDPAAGTRGVPFSRVLYIEREDFMEDPPRKYRRLAPGREVRLRYACFVRCVRVIKDAQGEVQELRCEYDPATRGGDAPDGRKPAGTLHWVSAAHARRAEVRLYEPLVRDDVDPEAELDLAQRLRLRSMEVLSDAFLEPSAARAAPGTQLQLERVGYFCVDADSNDERTVLNRSVALRDSWAKIARRGD